MNNRAHNTARRRAAALRAVEPGPGPASPATPRSARFGTGRWFQQSVQVLCGTRPCRGPERISRSSVGDAEYPGGRLRLATEVSRLLPDDPEGVVDDLFRYVITPGQARQEPP